MLFSVNYHSKYKQQADEIKCPYNQFGQIYKFLKDNRNKRYVIADASLDALEDVISQADIIKDEVRDYTIECSQIAAARNLIAEGYKAYLKHPVADWDSFAALVKLGVSDVYIDGPLGFQAQELRRAIENSKVSIRVSPTVSPNSSIVGASPESFYIRPEDLHLYEKSISVIDFKVTSQDKEDALFAIYKRGTFSYNIKDLIENCQFSVPNLFLKPEFGQARVNCGQRCKIPGHSCHLCDTQVFLTNMVYKYFDKKDEEKKDATS